MPKDRKVIAWNLKADVDREFVIRQGLVNLLGGVPVIQKSSPVSPNEAIAQMKDLLKDISKDDLNTIAERSREEVARELLRGE